MKVFHIDPIYGDTFKPLLNVLTTYPEEMKILNSLISRKKSFDKIGYIKTIIDF